MLKSIIQILFNSKCEVKKEIEKWRRGRRIQREIKSAPVDLATSH